jgi:hypothetical protein
MSIATGAGKPSEEPEEEDYETTTIHQHMTHAANFLLYDQSGRLKNWKNVAGVIMNYPYAGKGLQHRYLETRASIIVKARWCPQDTSCH